MYILYYINNPLLFFSYEYCIVVAQHSIDCTSIHTYIYDGRERQVVDCYTMRIGKDWIGYDTISYKTCYI